MSKTLVIGAGEAGSIISNGLKKTIEKMNKEERYIFRIINSSVNDSNKASEIEEDNKFLLEGVGGLAKEMQKVSEIMSEQGKKIVSKVFKEVFSGEAKKVLLISSLGGGTGCGITTNIITNMSEKLKNAGVKIRVLFVSPFKDEDMTAMRNTVAALQVMESFGIPTRIISNSNFQNVEGRTQQEVHNLINKYIAETEVLLQEAESFKTTGLNTDIAEIDKLLYTEGYTYITKVKLSVKDKEKNSRNIINKMFNSLDFEYNKDFHKYSLTIISATPELITKIDLEEINEHLGTTEKSRFKTFLQPNENDMFILIALSGCSFPQKINEIYDKVIAHNNEINKREKRKLNLNINNLFGELSEEGKEHNKNETLNMKNVFNNKKTEKIEVSLEDEEWF